MDYKVLCIGLFAGLCLSCAQQEKEFHPDYASGTFYATLEQPGSPDTKVFADEDLMILWHANDRVSVFDRYTYNQEYRFTGETGDNAGTLAIVPNNEIITGNALDHIYAVYPYRALTRISNTGVMTVPLPSEQIYAENNMAQGSNAMVSVTDSKSLHFKNLCGYLVLKLYGEGVMVSSIKVRGNTNEPLAGDATVSMTVGGYPSLVMQTDFSTNEVTLTCSEPVALNATADAYKEFWFVLPPTSFDSGFTITVTGPDGSTFMKSTSKSIDIARNELNRMAPVEVELSGGNVPPNNEIWYTSILGKIVEPYISESFGANIVSNTYVDGKGVLKFDGDVLTIPSYSFQWKSELSSMTLPNSVTTIGDYVYYSCGFESFSIPESVVEVGANPFFGCNNLRSFYGKYATGDHLALINGNEFLAFATGNKLLSYSIPEGIEIIGESAFFDCQNKEILIPEGVRVIGDAAFCGSALTEIVLPSSLISIGDGAFSGSALTEIVLPQGVVSIDNGAFSYCPYLESVTLPDSIETIRGNPFSNNPSLSVFYGKYATADHRSLIKEDSLLSFAGYGLSQYVIPEGVKTIGYLAFSESSVESLVLPSGVTTIEDWAFLRCASLKSITFPSSITRLGRLVLGNCVALGSITLLAEVPPEAEWAFFHETNDCPIYVPAASVESYKTTGYWTSYSDRIQAIPDHHSTIAGAVDLSFAQANCYVITAPGAYKIPALKGSSTNKVGNVYGVELVWESYNNAEIVTKNSVISTVDYEENWIYFQTPVVLKPGNAVIAAKDINGSIIWSWHIWIPATVITTNTYGIYNHALMDRNLGALVAAEAGMPAPVESFGLTYQWGRKDPFVGAQATTIGYVPGATVAGTPISVADGQITLAESIANPTLAGHVNDGDWLSRSDETLWKNDEKTIYDPCPAGYRVPAYDKDQLLMGSNLTTVIGFEDNPENGYALLGDPTAVFPLCGYRDDYYLQNFAKVYQRSQYWTSFGTEIRGYCVRFRTANDGNHFGSISTPKARAISVRCCSVEESPVNE